MESSRSLSLNKLSPVWASGTGSVQSFCLIAAKARGVMMEVPTVGGNSWLLPTLYKLDSTFPLLMTMGGCTGRPPVLSKTALEPLSNTGSWLGRGRETGSSQVLRAFTTWGSHLLKGKTKVGGKLTQHNRIHRS